MARTTGRYSGLQPAMTAMVAIFSTVAVRFMGWNFTRSPFLMGSPIRGPPVRLIGDHLVRPVAGALEHLLDPLFGGEPDGRAIGIDRNRRIERSGHVAWSGRRSPRPHHACPRKSPAAAAGCTCRFPSLWRVSGRSRPSMHRSDQTVDIGRTGQACAKRGCSGRWACRSPGPPA